jgi:uncharacterized membrane protein YuzA (DUF378 family)
MANPSIKRLYGPAAMSATLTTNLVSTGAFSGGVLGVYGYDIIKHIHVVNKTAGAVTFSLWIGGTTGNVAGTEFFNVQSVGANAVYDWYGNLKMLSTDFLVGGASAATSLTIVIEGETYVV